MRRVFDIEMRLPDRPGALAAAGEVLGGAGFSLEGGGVFVHNGVDVAHFLVADGQGAAETLRAAGIQVVGVRDVVTVRLKQEVPGQLGVLCGRMARAGVNIRVQYSDHAQRLVLVVDDGDSARAVARQWSRSG